MRVSIPFQVISIELNKLFWAGDERLEKSLNPFSGHFNRTAVLEVLE